MHIHVGQMNAVQSAHGAHSSTALAARRAEETRKKLFTSAMEPELTATADSPWVISQAGAWAGGNANSQEGGGLGHIPPAPEDAPDERVSPTQAMGAVSFWA